MLLLGVLSNSSTRDRGREVGTENLPARVFVAAAADKQLPEYKGKELFHLGT